MDEAPELVADDQNRCGEAPIWDPRYRRLLWTDIEAGRIYQLFPESGEKTVLSPKLPVAGIALNRTGELVLAGSFGLVLWRESGERRVIVSEHQGEPLCFNDLIADARGRIYAGTLHWGPGGMERPGKLYLIDRDGSARVVDEGIKLSNGLGFSPDQGLLYLADSAARVIHAYQVDAGSGSLSRRRVFARVPASEGIPDGLTVDEDGFVWSAQWYGAQVVRYDPEGSVERRVRLPVSQVSSLAFGGDDLRDLYITTAAEPWPSPLSPPGFDPRALEPGGALYRARTPVRGRPEHRADIPWSRD